MPPVRVRIRGEAGGPSFGLDPLTASMLVGGRGGLAFVFTLDCSDPVGAPSLRHVFCDGKGRGPRQPAFGWRGGKGG